MSKDNYMLELPASMKTAAARLAKQDGISLNDWITAAVAEKVAAITAARSHGVFSEWHSEADTKAYRTLAKPE